MMRRLFKNQYVVSLCNQGFHVVMGMINSILINRFLGPSLKGEYAYILNMVNISVLVMNFGMYESYPFYRRKKMSNIREKYKDIFFLQFIVYMMAAVVLSVFFRDTYLTAVFILVPVQVLNYQLGFIFMVEDVNTTNIIGMLSSAIYSLTLAVVYLLAPQNYLYVIALLFIQDGLRIGLLCKFFKMRVTLRFWKIDYTLLKKVAVFGLFPMLTAILSTLNYKLDVFILKMYVGYEQIGYYTLGTGLAAMAWKIPNAFKNVLFSKTAQKDSIEDIVLSIKITLYINLIIVAGVTFAGRFAIQLLYGVEYLPAYGVTIVIFAGIIPMAFFRLITTLFLAKGKQRLSFEILLASVVLNIISNFLLIPRMGINGAALASVLSYSICGYAFLYIFSREYNLNPAELFIPKEAEIMMIRRFIHKPKTVGELITELQKYAQKVTKAAEDVNSLLTTFNLTKAALVDTKNTTANSIIGDKSITIDKYSEGRKVITTMKKYKKEIGLLERKIKGRQKDVQKQIEYMVTEQKGIADLKKRLNDVVKELNMDLCHGDDE
jgi:O-antigen/teichoic acid export membrane protein